MNPIVYNNNYNYYTPPLFPHPFNPYKSRQILDKLTTKNHNLSLFCPDKIVSIEDLLKVHDKNYLDGG